MDIFIKGLITYIRSAINVIKVPQIERRVIMGKTIAYLRVSTDQQDLNNQKHEIE